MHGTGYENFKQCCRKKRNRVWITRVAVVVFFGYDDPFSQAGKKAWQALRLNQMEVFDRRQGSEFSRIEGSCQRNSARVALQCIGKVILEPRRIYSEYVQRPTVAVENSLQPAYR